MRGREGENAFLCVYTCVDACVYVNANGCDVRVGVVACLCVRYAMCVDGARMCMP